MSVAQQPIQNLRNSSSSSDNEKPPPRQPGEEVLVPEGQTAENLPYAEREEIHENECYDELGFSFPTWKKWAVLSIIFLVQTSMNFNTSLYSNAISGIAYDFGVSKQVARLGAALFLITYAFGCELWAPWSEEFGRKPILQLSLFLTNIWHLPVGFATNFGTILVARSLGGLSTAGGSVTLGMVADLWEAENQQYAVAFVVLSSVGGSILGPLVGGPVEQFLDWKWAIWIQLIFGAFVQLLHLLVVPETRTTIMMDKIAKKRRKANPRLNIFGPSETKPLKERLTFKAILTTWYRPFQMFLTEPIVLVLSLLSGFSDALIFMFIQSFALVYELWHFNPVEIGLAFLPILVGYFLAWGAFIPAFKRNKRDREQHPEDEKSQYESRLWFLLWMAPCLPIGLLGYGYTCTGPPLHWIGSMVFAALIGVANYSIYMATIDYMICAYGPYSASATGGNGWARDILAGILTLPATPFFQNIGPKDKTVAPNHLSDAFMILFSIAAVLVMAVYAIYFYGPFLRKRSPFACQLADAAKENNGRQMSVMPETYGSTGAQRQASMARARSSLAASRGNSVGLGGSKAHQDRLAKIAEQQGIEGAEPKEKDASQMA